MDITKEGSTIQIRRIKTSRYNSWMKCAGCRNPFAVGNKRYTYRAINDRTSDNWTYNICNGCLNLRMKRFVRDAIGILKGEFNSGIVCPKLE